MTTTPTVQKPTKTLPAKADVKNSTQLGMALHELCWLSSAERAERAACDAEIAEIKAACEKRIAKLTPRGVSFADRLKALKDGAFTFARAARDTLLAGGGKTARFTHGEVSFANSRQCVDVTDQKVLNKKLASIEARVTELLAGEKIGGIPVTELFAVKASLSKTAALKAVKEKRVTPSKLKTFGVSVVKPGETITISPYSYTVESQADAA